MTEVQLIQGVKRVLFWRLLKEAASKAATRIALQTEHEVSSSRDVNAVVTKDGTKRTLGTIEQEITATTYLSTTDEVERLKQAHEKGEIIELWDLIAELPDEHRKYAATYYQAYLSEISESAPTDDGIEVSLTFAVEGIGKRGRTAVTEDQAAIIDYLFVEVTTGATQEKARQAAGLPEI